MRLLKNVHISNWQKTYYGKCTPAVFWAGKRWPLDRFIIIIIIIIA